MLAWNVRDESVLAWMVAALRKMVEPTKVVPPEPVPGAAPLMVQTWRLSEESWAAWIWAALMLIVEMDVLREAMLETREAVLKYVAVPRPWTVLCK